MAEKKSHVDLIAGLLAGFVGACALCVSIYSTHLQRQQIRAQVWPRLAFSFSTVPDWHFELSNPGVGPAEIRTVSITVDGKPIASWGALQDLFFDHKERRFTTSYLRSRVIPAGGKVDIIHVEEIDVAKVLHDQFMNRVSVTLCYCSVLEECWLIVDDKHDAIDKCPAPSTPFMD